MRAIQYGLSPESAPCGSPLMFFPTSVNVAPLSRLTWRLPSSVPAHTTPRATGDSDTAMMVLYAVTPSFFESCAVFPAAPITVVLHRSTCFVRSPLATQRSPWLSDRKRRSPPIQIVLGLCGDRRIGVFQLKRCVSPARAFTTFGDAAAPPRPPPPPPLPPPPAAMIRPSTQEPAAGAGGASGDGGATGRMLFVMPVLKSV